MRYDLGEKELVTKLRELSKLKDKVELDLIIEVWDNKIDPNCDASTEAYKGGEELTNELINKGIVDLSILLKGTV